MRLGRLRSSAQGGKVKRPSLRSGRNCVPQERNEECRSKTGPSPLSHPVAPLLCPANLIMSPTATRRERQALNLHPAPPERTKRWEKIVSASLSLLGRANNVHERLKDRNEEKKGKISSKKLQHWLFTRIFYLFSFFSCLL